MSGPANQLVRLKVTDIKVADRLRPVDPDWAAALAGSIAREGLLSPIDVCAEGKGYRLVAGAHRLQAHQLLGRDEIDAFVRSHDALERRAREIAENIMRHELDPLDRAAHIAELYEVELQRAGISPQEHARKLGGMAKAAREKAEVEGARDNLSLAYNLQEQVAEKVGFSTRTLKRDLALHRGLKPAAVELLRGTKVAGAASQLLSLAKLPEKDQLAAAQAIVAGTASNAAYAIRVVAGGREPPKGEKKAGSIVAAFDQLDTKWKGETLRRLAKLKLPKGFQIIVPGGEA